MKLILLAAGKGSRIFRNIKTNKCLIKIFGETLIKNIIKFSNRYIQRIFCVVGFNKNEIKKTLKNYKIDYVYNKYFDSTDMLYSTYLGLKKINNDDIVIFYTDTFYEKKFITKICKIKSKNIVVPVSSVWEKMWKIRKKKIKTDAEDIKIDQKNNIIKIGKKITSRYPKFQYMGVIFIPKKKLPKIKKFMRFCLNEYKKMHLTNFINFLIEKKIKVKALKNSNNWYEFDDYNDLKNFRKKYEKIDNFNL